MKVAEPFESSGPHSEFPRARATHEEPGVWVGNDWASRQVELLAAAWDRGERMSAADILDRTPHADTETALRLIYEEVCLHREAGSNIDVADVVRRYPRWAEELQSLFDCDRLLGAADEVLTFPAAGDTLGPFRLLTELGRGASGRTFLAQDPGLADRPVVIKVIPDDQDEHLALARLRHTHIVPLFSEHSFPDRGLRILCMPYLGGVSLSRILEDFAEIPHARRSGKLLVELIDRNTPPTPAPPPPDSPFRRSLERASYAQAISWITACLADALHYAHGRGLVHMDIKPSNILITLDGQPILLDFHLARGPIRAGDWISDRLGGTPGWMAPEQERALASVDDGQPVSECIDGRADIFALGLVLREALPTTVSNPRLRQDARSAVRTVPGVSLGLRDILNKCLEPNSAHRYVDAATLADDLRRHVNDLPLRGARNRSILERWRKWRRRHPSTFAWGVTGLAVLLAAISLMAVGASSYRQRIEQLQFALEDGRRLERSGQHDAAIRALERGLSNIRSTAGIGPLAGAVREELRRARHGRLAAELHELADRIRYRYGIELPADKDARALMRDSRTIFDRRGQLLSFPPGSLGADTAQHVRVDLLEITLVWSDLRIRLAAPENLDDARHDVLRSLDDASADLGHSLALDLRRSQLFDHATAARAANDAIRMPETAWEHYDNGRHALRGGRIESAAEEFRRALLRKPDDFWSNFYEGLCSFRLGRYADSVAAFRACNAIEPRSAICRYNRALAHEALGQTELAFDEYTRAIELDPAFSSARLKRGMISRQRGKPLEAIADFEHALGVASLDSETVGRLRYGLALAQLALGNRSSALENAEQAARVGYTEAESLRDDLAVDREGRNASKGNDSGLLRPRPGSSRK
jgi:eukaryotic-like serine/threonine-protein kinase